jgi:hypothetical protein
MPLTRAFNIGMLRTLQTNGRPHCAPAFSFGLCAAFPMIIHACTRCIRVYAKTLMHCRFTPEIKR